jgi:electron transport complex protein RnfG
MLKSIISNLLRSGAALRGGPLRSGASVVLLAALVLVPLSARADVFYSVRQLLAEQFKASARVSYVKVRLTSAQRAHIEQRLGRGLAKADYTVYVATTAGHVDGYALFDEERGQHEPISFGTFFDPQGRVTRVEVLAYREPYGSGIRAERFRRQFVGRDGRSGFAAERDIDAISGASISSRSMCTGVQRATVLLDETVLRGPTVVAAL